MQGFVYILYLFHIAAMQTYHVHVYTGDKRGAGTDANVFITLYGEHDDTGKLEWEKFAWIVWIL